MAEQPNKVTNDLIKMGFGKKDILQSIEEVDMRLLWDIGSFCSIYSRRNQIWNDGQIIDIFIDETTNEEWLRVKYNINNTKNIQRFNDCVQSIDANEEFNQQIIQIITNQLSMETKNTNIKKQKWDKHKEIETVKWINQIMNQKLMKPIGPEFMQNFLENGQLLCRIINKIEPNLIDSVIIKQKPNDDEYDTKRIYAFIECTKAFGVNDEELFEIEDLKQNGNMSAVLNTLYALKTVITHYMRFKPIPVFKLHRLSQDFQAKHKENANSQQTMNAALLYLKEYWSFYLSKKRDAQQMNDDIESFFDENQYSQCSLIYQLAMNARNILIQNELKLPFGNGNEPTQNELRQLIPKQKVKIVPKALPKAPPGNILSLFSKCQSY